MKRRTVFKHLAVASAAAWLLPACVSDPKKVSIALNRLQVTGDEEALLGDLADVMIPSNGGPGARAVGAHLFALVMVDDCLPEETRQKFLKGMRSFDDAVGSLTGTSFTQATDADERLALLKTFEQNLDKADDDVRTFYSRARDYIIQGYTSSQYFLTEVKPYQLVPGPNYNGCAPVAAESTSKSLS